MTGLILPHPQRNQYPAPFCAWAPAGPFSLYLRAYWPERPILDGTWTPPPVTRFG
jgi:hypothetical protein